jgi:small subunit ribosomal protein S15
LGPFSFRFVNEGLVSNSSCYHPQSAQLVQQPKPLFVSLSEIGEVNSAEDDEEPSVDIDSPPAEDFIVNVGDLEGDEEEGVEDDGEPPAWFASAQRIDALREEHRRHDNDTGSPEYQVAGMTERITYLTKHLKLHPKDFSTRRGLVALVNKRRRLLNYLYSSDINRYAALVGSLGIRHKAPGRVPDKEEQYSRFPGQKAAKKHLIKKK